VLATFQDPIEIHNFVYRLHERIFENDDELNGDNDLLKNKNKTVKKKVDPRQFFNLAGVVLFFRVWGGEFFVRGYLKTVCGVRVTRRI
jgi:hypothetical protein